MAENTDHPKATLLLELNDLNHRPVTHESKIILKLKDGEEDKCYQAEGPDGVVTHFTFKVGAGVYTVNIDCEGFESQELLVTLHAEERRSETVFLRAREDDEDDRGEGPLIEGRIRAFSEPRSQGLEGFPINGRADALQQRERMIDPDVINAPFIVTPVTNPLPFSSLNDIAAWVNVKPRNESPFHRSLLKIPYQAGYLGWVDSSSLRVFAFNANSETAEFELIPRSGADTERHWAWCYIDQPGIYGVIGLPREGVVRDVVRLLKQPDVNREAICNLLRNSKGLTPPGNFDGSAFDLCSRLLIPRNGLPENHLLDGPPPPGPSPGPPPTGACSWVSIGPRNINGRITALVVHPGVPNLVWAGTANAGVWRSDNGGISWTPLMFTEGALEIGALALHLSNPALPAGDVTIYAGIGETRYAAYRGIGVLKSTVSGSPGSWTSTGYIPANTFTCVAIDPSTVTAAGNSTVVYAGGPTGLYKSSNAGGSWTNILSENIASMVLDPSSLQTIYAGISNKGVYKYQTNWAPFNVGITDTSPNLVAVDKGRSAPYTLYAKIDQTVYKYDDVGLTWTSLGNHGEETYEDRRWNNYVAVDPTDSNIVFVGGLSIARTYDGGINWQAIQVLHPDQHALAFDSGNHFKVYAGNDGGVFEGTYTSLSDTGTWTKRSNGLTITQFNSFDAYASFPELIGGGTQDNGTIRTAGSLTWDSTNIGGDGSGYIIDPSEPRIQYGQLTSPGLNSHPYKSIDGGVTFSPADNGFMDGPFVGVMVLDPNSPSEPNRVLFVSSGGDDGPVNVVQRSSNSAGNWTTSSPPLGGAVTALAVAPSSSAFVFAGTKIGTVWRSSDGGVTLANWKDVTIPSTGSASLPSNRRVTKILIHPTSVNEIYVTFSGFGTGHVFHGTSTDGWTNNWTWVDISANLTDIPVHAIEIGRPVASPPTLWIGTDTSVFRTTDGGISWAPFDNGLPNVVVSDLRLNGSGNVLRAATYGYSMWEIHLADSCPQVDIYIRDDKLDIGEGSAPSGVPDPTQATGTVYWWDSVDIKTDVFPYQPAPLDGVDFDYFVHQNPVVNDASHPQPNKAYIQVINRGPQPSSNVKAKVLWADASGGLPPLPADFWSNFPNAWTSPSSWLPVDPAIPFKTIPQLLPHTPQILEWDWIIPTTAAQHSCMLAVISADDDPVTRSDAIPDDHLIWVVEPNDKHVALHNLSVVGGRPSMAAREGGQAPLPPIYIDLHNPLQTGGFFDILFDPEMLPKGTKANLFLPDLQLQTNVPGLQPACPPWKYQFDLLVDIGYDKKCGRPMSTIPGIFIPPLGKLKVAVEIAVPEHAPGGATYRSAILQRQGGVIIGGNTVEVRVPPLEVVVEHPNCDEK